MKTQYYWMNANPKEWALHENKVGDIESYTIYNDKKHKRFVFQSFLDANIGDIVICYQGGQNGQILAIYKVSQPVKDPDDYDGELYIQKMADIPNGVTKEELISRGLKDIMPIKVGKGSLFTLDEQDYLTILDVIEEKNKDFLKDTDISGNIAERIEKLSVEQAVAYSKSRGTYYLGQNFADNKIYLLVEIKSELKVDRIKTLTRSKRDNTVFIFDIPKQENIVWQDNDTFQFIYEYKTYKPLDYYLDLRHDLELDKYVFVFKEIDTDRYQYLGIAELEIITDEETRNGDKYIYVVTIEGKLIDSGIHTTEEMESTGTGYINIPMKPNGVLEENGNIRIICANCGAVFKKAKRCPECGQLQDYKEQI